MARGFRMGGAGGTKTTHYQYRVHRYSAGHYYVYRSVDYGVETQVGDVPTFSTSDSYQDTLIKIIGSNSAPYGLTNTVYTDGKYNGTDVSIGTSWFVPESVPEYYVSFDL